MNEAYAFDVDGVLVDNEVRARKAMELSRALGRDFHEVLHYESLLPLDKPRESGIKLYKNRSKKGLVIIVTGRPKKLLKATINQIVEFTGIKPHYVLTRSNNDRRPSYKVKADLIALAIKKGMEVIEFHDDDKEVLREIRSRFPWVRLYLHEGPSYRVF